jgi:ankyrin repeat protein
MMQGDELKECIREGYYAFQDYAVSYWFDHMRSSIEASLEDPVDIHEHLARQLELFLEDYGIPDKRESYPRNRETRNVAEVLRCIPQDARARNQWFDVEWRTSCIRSTIESLREEGNLDEANADLIWQIYGVRRFKCPKIWCNHFATGFDSKAVRDQHLNRHNRPFVCVVQDCPFQALRFETEEQLEQHLARHHVGVDADQFLFPQPAREKGDNIYKASARGDNAALKRFLDRGANINTTSRTKGGETPLFLAARNSHLHVCKTLLESGADANFKGPPGSIGSTALHAAVSSGSIEMVHYFLSLSNVLPDERNGDDQSRLHIAAERKSKAVVDLLSSTGKVDPNVKDNYGRTPLIMAVETGAETVVKLLLENGNVDPDAKNDGGQTPLSRAAAAKAETMVKLLLATGKVDPDAKDNNGRTPLSRAADKGAEVIIKLLLATGNIDPDAKDNDGRTPLSRAAENGAKNGTEAIIKLLLATGKVDPDAKDNDGRTPLILALEVGAEAVVKLLLETDSVDPDAKHKDSRTLLGNRQRRSRYKR